MNQEIEIPKLELMKNENKTSENRDRDTRYYM